MHPIKSYGQIKIDSEIMAVSFVFSRHFDPKFAPLGQAIPGVLRAHLYVFGISGTWGMGIATVLI